MLHNGKIPLGERYAQICEIFHADSFLKKYNTGLQQKQIKDRNIEKSLKIKMTG